MATEALLRPDGSAQLALPLTDRSDAKQKGRRLKEALTAGRLYEDAVCITIADSKRLSDEYYYSADS